MRILFPPLMSPVCSLVPWQVRQFWLRPVRNSNTRDTVASMQKEIFLGNVEYSYKTTITLKRNCSPRIFMRFHKVLLHFISSKVPCFYYDSQEIVIVRFPLHSGSLPTLKALTLPQSSRIRGGRNGGEG